jgi:hypothetical protein
MHRARSLHDQENLQADLVLLRNVFRQNGYNERQIHRVPNRQSDDNPDSVAFLPYVGTIFNRISRVLSRHNIKSVGLPINNYHFFRPAKYKLGLRIPSVYRIPCDCGMVYIFADGPFDGIKVEGASVAHPS